MGKLSHHLQRAKGELRDHGFRAFLRGTWFVTASRAGKSRFSVTLPWCSFTVAGNPKKLGVSGYIYAHRGDYERALQPFFDHCNGAFLDIGANIGYWTCYVAGRSRRGDGGVTGIAAFEPQASCYELLRLNAEKANSAAVPVWLENKALGPRSGRVAAVATNDDPGSTYMVPSDSGNIEQMSLDDWLEDHNLGRIGLIKIDVEGYELEVLTGSCGTLRRWKPAIICELVEAHQRRNGHSASDVFSFLTGLGYSGAWVDQCSAAVPCERFTHNGNYLFRAKA